MTLDELNDLSTGNAEAVLRECCGSSRWVNLMTAGRPFESVAAVMSASDEAWSMTGEPDWREAFAHHPRIGDTRADGWAGAEQSGARDAASVVKQELAQVNGEYEAKFGHTYIVCATGRGAEEMLRDARTRMDNDPVTELRIAAGEQHRITQLRLQKLLRESE